MDPGGPFEFEASIEEFTAKNTEFSIKFTENIRPAVLMGLSAIIAYIKQPDVSGKDLYCEITDKTTSRQAIQYFPVPNSLTRSRLQLYYIFRKRTDIELSKLVNHDVISSGCQVCKDKIAQFVSACNGSNDNWLNIKSSIRIWRTISTAVDNTRL